MSYGHYVDGTLRNIKPEGLNTFNGVVPRVI